MLKPPMARPSCKTASGLTSFDEEIIAIVSAHVTDPTLGGAANLTEARLLRMAEAIAKATSVRAADPNHETPFAKGARKVRCC